MHSSRMRTVRCSGHWGMYPSMHWAGGCLPGVSAGGSVCWGSVCWWGVCLGVSAQGVLPRGCLPGGVYRGVSATPPAPLNRMTDDCENYVADGKKHNIPWDNRACSLVTKVQTYRIASNEIKQYNNRREFA